MIRSQPLDLLITDIKMRFVDGLVLSQRVHREFADTEIIIINGHDDFQLARQAIKIRLEQYLLKPVTKADLMRALAEVREKLEMQHGYRAYSRRT